MQWHPENQNEIKTLERCQHSCALGNNFDLCKCLVPLTTRHNKFSSHCKNFKSHLSFVIQNRRCGGKDSDEVSGHGKSSFYIQHDKTLTGVRYHECVKPSSTKSLLSDHQKTYPGGKSE